jgi:non-haem Fe2+, alpha-ketoglutarate-dependent halogenase
MSMLAASPSRSYALTNEELKQFHERGYCGPFKVYEPDQMKTIWRTERIRLLNRSRAIYQTEEAVSGVTNIANYDRHLDNAFLADHICKPQIVDRVASILGPDVLCWRTEFFPKYPGDEGTDWHQADTFANASGQPQIVWQRDKEFGGTITVWSAFTEAGTETAALQFIPGTHRTMYYDETKRMHYDPEKINREDKEGVRRGFFGYDYRQLQKDPHWTPDESKAISMVMRPGEAILFWSTLMHASHPHVGKSKEMRLGYAARYVPTSVHIYPDTDVVEEYGGKVSLEKYGAVLVSGHNDFAHNRIATHTTEGKPFGHPFA